MMIGVSCLLYVFAVAAVVLRFVAQRSLQRKLRVDDVLMLFALVRNLALGEPRLTESQFFGTGLFVTEVMCKSLELLICDIC